MGRRATAIELSPEERRALERLRRSSSTPQGLARRAQMILMADDGLGVVETAERLGVWRKGVSQWRARWLAASPATSVVERLADAPRSGAPARITAEQVCAIVALACERPQDSGVPLSHWSASDLAREVVQRGILPSISPRSVGRFLKRSGPQAASRPALAHSQA